jgi:hypothetical protein
MFRCYVSRMASDRPALPVPLGALAVAGADRATLEAELEAARSEVAALRADAAEDLAAWLAGRAAVLALYRRRTDEARRQLGALDARRVAIEAELAAAAGRPDIERARLGAVVAHAAGRADAQRARLAELEAVAARIERGDG